MKSKKGTWCAIIAIIIIAIIAIWVLSTPSTNQVIDVEGQDMIEGLSQD